MFIQSLRAFRRARWMCGKEEGRNGQREREEGRRSSEGEEGRGTTDEVDKIAYGPQSGPKLATSETQVGPSCSTVGLKIAPR